MAKLNSKDKDPEKRTKDQATGRNLMVAATVIFIFLASYVVLRYRHRLHGDNTTSAPLVASSQTTITEAKVDAVKSTP